MMHVRKYLSKELIFMLRSKTPPLCACDRDGCVMCRPLIGAKAAK